MLFYESLFLFLFFPVLLILYFLIGHTYAAQMDTTRRELFFYAWSEPIFVLIVLASSRADHAIERFIGTSKDQRARRDARARGSC
jgi:alginate O-acetyltransferase complex protein AlgI